MNLFFHSYAPNADAPPTISGPSPNIGGPYMNEIADGTRIRIDKTRQRIKFENETEQHVTIVIEGKE